MFAAYFSFIDANIKGGTTGVSTTRYFYSVGTADVYSSDYSSMTEITAAQTYSGIGASPANARSSVVRSTLYHFYIPPEVVRLLNSHESVRIYIEVTTTFSNGDVGIGYDSLELRKIGLLGLK